MLFILSIEEISVKFVQPVLLFLLIAFIACTKLEDIDFGPILKEMRNYRLVFAKKNKTDDSTISGKNSTKNDSNTNDTTDTIDTTDTNDTSDSTDSTDTTDSSDSTDSPDDDPERPKNFAQKVWAVIKNAWKWLKEHGVLKKIQDVLLELGTQAAITYCGKFVGISDCRMMLLNQ